MDNMHFLRSNGIVLVYVVIFAILKFQQISYAFNPGFAVKSTRRLVILGASAGNVQKPENEFSRTYNAEVLLYGRKRDYEVSIEANEEELASLSKRFNLADIGSLQADLGMKMQDGKNIRVQGTIYGTVTQNCVRTNEPFEREFTHDFFTIMQPVGSSNIENSVDAVRYETKRRSKRNDKIRSNQKVDESSIKQLQDNMQGFDIQDDIIEDSSVYDNGTIDVGELVSQIFRVKLDPFPKKPGTDPISLEFSL